MPFKVSHQLYKGHHIDFDSVSKYPKEIWSGSIACTLPVAPKSQLVALAANSFILAVA